MCSERDVRVLVADDQAPFRRAALAVIAATPGFALAAEASSGEEAVALAAQVRPDLVLLDVRMPGLGGVAAARRIAAPLTVLISTYRAEDLAEAAGMPFLLKGDFGSAALRALWNERQVSCAAR